MLAASIDGSLAYRSPGRRAVQWQDMLLSAAEDPDACLHVRPQKGQAIVFWTLDTVSGVDPFSWHAGARVRPGSHKWIAQKFKELPVYLRPKVPATDWTKGLALPAHLAPEGM